MTFNNQLIAFDIDGTIAESKQDITAEMSRSLEKLLRFYDIALISGCRFEQMVNQVADRIPHNDLDHNQLYLLPTSGAQLYEAIGVEYVKIYNNNLAFREKVAIYNTWHLAVTKVGGWASDTWGEIAEDRKSQITFSMCGQEAPLRIKEEYDADQTKRMKIVAEMTKEPLFSCQYETRIGGTTSIDVTKKGLDKNYGISRLLEHTGYQPTEVLFLGDALYPGGNDQPVLKTGVECIEVKDPSETLEYINDLLEIKGLK